eukprot:COSAG06_NODE_230_length_19685_cov_14.110844_14_plen_182_part_00
MQCGSRGKETTFFNNTRRAWHEHALSNAFEFLIGTASLSGPQACAVCATRQAAARRAPWQRALCLCRRSCRRSTAGYKRCAAARPQRAPFSPKRAVALPARRAFARSLAACDEGERATTTERHSAHARLTAATAPRRQQQPRTHTSTCAASTLHRPSLPMQWRAPGGPNDPPEWPGNSCPS